jgi:hypothetical protein
MIAPQFSGWKKSSYSANGNNCVEVAAAPGVVGVRDSKLGADSPILTVTPAGWSTFVSAVKAGQFDL